MLYIVTYLMTIHELVGCCTAPDCRDDLTVVGTTRHVAVT